MKLKDFYRKTADLNISERGGWASNYYGVVSRLIAENGYTRVAEVGIGYGTHARQILQTTTVDHLYLIDPTVHYPNDGFAADILQQEAEIPGNHFNELADLIRAELKPWESRYTWFRTPSLTITQEQIPDGSLDCVFVDADHSYPAVLNDLRFWWSKVRPGGQLLGDDYWMTSVAKAVEEFAAEKGLAYDFLYRQGSAYKIYRFKKDAN